MTRVRMAVAMLLIAASVPASAGPSCESISSRLSNDGWIEILNTTQSSILAAGRGFSGGVTIICGGNQTSTDLIIGVNSQAPDNEFMSYFGDLAHSVTGVNAKEAQDAAFRCYRSGKGYKDKGQEHGLFEGDRIDTKTIHVDCRVGDNFTSFGVFKP